MTSRDAPGAPIALIGIGCRFPGGVVDAASFWRLLSEGVDAITEVPPDRIDLGRFFAPEPGTPGRIASKWGGFLDRIHDFDATFFGISPREAERLDPQQRVALETAWEALEDAGQDVKRLQGTQTAVFVGQWQSDFEGRLFADAEAADFHVTNGSGRYATSGRVSYFLGLQGASFTIDCACTSSLAAVHLAIQSLRSGESALALAGGVNMILQPQVSIAYSSSRMLAPDGRCKFGDVRGDGYVRSEGGAMVALKRLDRALADGDRIYAVILGSAVNNDGRSSGYLGRPSQVGQEQMLRLAYENAGASPGLVRYVEAHGTGTRAGDPVELRALGAVLSEGRKQGHRAYVGSVKTNIGHTEGAAGLAGLIKAALSLHHDAIPPSLHFREPNPAIPWPEMPFDIPRQLTAWPEGQGPRLAGVSSFGISGTNAHVVLAEAPPRARRDAVPGHRGPFVLPLSGQADGALRAMAIQYAELLGAPAAPSLEDVCWSAATRRTGLDHRAIFVAADTAGMADALRRFADGEAPLAAGIVSPDARPKIAFVLPGQGAQWVGMARELMASDAVFRRAMEECDAAARRHVGWSIMTQLALDPGDDGYLLDRIDVIQPVLVAMGIAYAELWRSLGVEPAAVVGHSMGEVAAACIAGVLDLDQAMHIICRRSSLMQRTSGRGAMALVELSMDEARAYMAGREDRLSVAVSNSPRSSVISGEPAAVTEVMDALEREQIFCRLVKVDVASHSPQMDPVAAGLRTELDGLNPGKARVPIYSTVRGGPAEGQDFTAAYWASNVRQPVLLTDTVARMLDDGITIFVELGPHPILQPSILQTAQALSREATALTCGRREEPDQAAMLTAIGGLWTSGHAVDWRRVMPQAGEPVSLPPYPWQRERHWADIAEIGFAQPAGNGVLRKPDAESLGWLHGLSWETSEVAPATAGAPFADQSWLVLAPGDLRHSLAAALAEAGGKVEVEALDELERALEARGAAQAPLHGLLVLAEEGPDAAYLPLRVMQALLRPEWRSRPKIWFVTRGSQSAPVDSAAPVAVNQAALWGAARVIAEEHPEVWGGLVDLDPGRSVPEQVPLLIRHITADDGEDQVALREDRRRVLRLVPRAVEDVATGHAWRPDVTYLVTGGLGGVALHVARAMAAGGARRLVLLGRTALPPRDQWRLLPPGTQMAERVAAVRELEAAGVAVHVACVDVGDEAELRAFLDGFEREAWPPIRGVVHAAGTLDNHLAGAMDVAAFDAVVGPKLRGAQLLDRLLPDLDLFVLFSSTGAFLAQPGQANYAAANAGLDALALDRRARGRPALSIGWGVWLDTGLVKGESGQSGVAELARQGIRGFAPERGASLFAWLCGRLTGSCAVIPVDWNAYRRSRSGRPIALLRTLVGDGEAVPALRDHPELESPAVRRARVETLVREAVGAVLKVAPSRLDPRRALGNMGFNSLMAMELRNRLEASLGRPLSATLAWNYPTVNALVGHLAGDEPAVATPAPSAPAATANRIADVAALSDDDAALALRTRRPRA